VSTQTQLSDQKPLHQEMSQLNKVQILYVNFNFSRLLDVFNVVKSEFIMKDFRGKDGEEEYEDDDDVASCSSSDLFELDHLAVMGINRLWVWLPFYFSLQLFQDI
jgi:hypothetical protein